MHPLRLPASADAAPRSSGRRRALLGLWAFTGNCLAGPPAPGSQVPPSAAPTGVAVVLDLQGGGELVHAGRRGRLHPLQTLVAGDALDLPAAAHAEVAFPLGAQRCYLLDGPGRFDVDADALRARGAQARLAPRDLVGDWRGLRLQPGMVGRASVALRGPDAVRGPARHPAGGQRPRSLGELQWEAPGDAVGAWRYRVTMFDGQGRVLFAAQTEATRFALPERRWPGGQSFVWTLSAVDEAGRHQESSTEFHVVDADVDAWIAGAEASARAARQDGSGSPTGVPAEDVLFALALEQAGLREESDRQWHRIAAGRPALAAWDALGR